MARRGIAKPYDIAAPWLEAEHGVEACNAVHVAVGNFQVVRTGPDIFFCKVVFRVVILEIMEYIKDIIQRRIEFF